MRLPLAALLLAAAPAALAENTIHLVRLEGKGVPPKGVVAAMAAEANAVYKRLGLKTTVAVVADPAAFDPRKIDAKSSVAVIGRVPEIAKFVAKDPDNARFLQQWAGGDEPERSQNDYAYLGTYRGGGKFIALDAAGFPAFAGVLKWSPVQTAAFLIVHGSGHNSDFDGQLQHNEFGGIMTDGAVLQWQVPDKTFATVTSPGANAKLIAHLKSRYGP